MPDLEILEIRLFNSDNQSVPFDPRSRWASGNCGRRRDFV